MNDESRGPPRSFKLRVGFVLAALIVTLAFLGLLVHAIQVVLLAFAGILGGIVLSVPTTWLAARSRWLPRPLALVLVLLVLLGAAAGLGVLVGATLSNQFEQLARQLPEAASSVIERTKAVPFVQTLSEKLPPLEEMLSSSRLADSVSTAFTSIGGALAAAAFIAVTSLFFALQPPRYIDPVVRLLPPEHRARAGEVVDEIAKNLRAWLLARFISMAAVTVLTALGLWIVGIPAWASLAVLAGVLSFIPNLGPILSAVPGILFGLAQSPMTAVWAGLVYVIVQIIEGNFITPFAEQRAVSIPAAYLLTVQLAMGLLAGVLGLMVATPALVVVVVTVHELHVKRLEDREPRGIEIPTEAHRLAG